MANQIFRIKHGLDVADKKLVIAVDTGDMTVESAVQANSTLTVGSKLTVSTGGADINGLLVAKDDLQVDGNLIVHGTTTTVNSTTVTVDDPIFTLGGDSDPTADDSKDRGIEFRYYDGSAKTGFMGYDNNNSKFRFFTGATNDDEVFSGTDGILVGALEGNADTATAFATAGTFSLTGGDVNAVSNSSIDGNYSLAVTVANDAITFAKMQDITSMKVIGRTDVGSGGVSEIAILDEDGMTSNSATSLASQQSIKAYVDAEIDASNSMSELTDVEISGIAQAHMLFWDNAQARWENKAVSGDLTISQGGVATVGANKITNAMIENESLAVTAGNGLSGGGSVVLGGTITLTVNTDDSSIEINNDILRTKALGITNAMLAGSIASTKIAELNNFDTGDLSEGSNLYYTEARVRANRLDQLTAPTVALSLNSQKIINLSDGTSVGDAINKGQLDSHNHNGDYAGLVHTHSIHNLSDVDTTTAPIDRQALVWSTTNSLWQPGVGGALSTSSATAPSSPNLGDFWYNINDNVLYTRIADGAGTELWIDISTGGAAAGGTDIIAMASAPTNPIIGDHWYDTNDNTLFLRIVDGAGTEVWIDISTGDTGGTAITSMASSPVSPLLGDHWYDTNDNTLYLRIADEAGTEVWIDISTGDTGGTAIIATPQAPENPMVGDHWYDTDDNILYLRIIDGFETEVWLDISTEGGVSFSALDTSPVSPTIGSFWYDTDDNILYMRVADGAGTELWLDISSAGTGGIWSATPENASLDGTVALKSQSSAPSSTNDYSKFYSVGAGTAAEMHVLDGSGNDTLISPHNTEGEWEYYSENKRTGKKVRINMERMIRKLEEITGETFIEDE